MSQQSRALPQSRRCFSVCAIILAVGLLVVVVIMSPLLVFHIQQATDAGEKGHFTLQENASVRTQSDPVSLALTQENTESFIDYYYDSDNVLAKVAAGLKEARRLNLTATACPPNQLYCSAQGCILDFLRCNKINDCPNREDEIGCTCRDYLQNLYPQRICDVYEDCLDRSDEIGCATSCEDGQFRCDGTRCIERRWVCDGRRNCVDGTDELNCGGLCPAGEFSCSAGHCIPMGWVCDGRANCRDGKDENSCLKLAPSETRLETHDTFDNQGYLFYRKEGNWFPVCANGDDRLFDHFCKITGYSGLRTKSNKFTFGSWDSYAAPSALMRTPQYEDFAISQSCPSFYPVFLHCDSGTCGHAPQCVQSGESDKRRSKRIVGGTPAGINCHPWAVALYNDGRQKCMGVVVSERWLLTAAHCFRELQSRQSKWIARLGFTRQKSHSPQERFRVIDRVLFHPEYTHQPLESNDIAMIRMERAVPFSDVIQPPCLPAPGEEPALGLVCYVVGWGFAVENGGRPVDELQQVTLEVMNSTKCNDAPEFAGRIGPGHLCMSHGYLRKDACQGDSGGPLLCRDQSGREYLAGITSTGYGCARPNTPGIWTKVAHYRDWIEQMLKTPRASVDVGSQAVCPGFRCLLGDCLYAHMRCDGYFDCANDNSDEEGCPAGTVSN